MPKPILSDSLFNADDVATAILSEANLQVTNSDLGVTDVTSSYVLNSNWDAWDDDFCYKFNGFVFVQLNAYIDSVDLSSNLTVYTINDSNLHPSSKQSMPTITFDNDSATGLYFHTNGNVIVLEPKDMSSNPRYHLKVNGWYRI